MMNGLAQKIRGTPHIFKFKYHEKVKRISDSDSKIYQGATC